MYTTSGGSAKQRIGHFMRGFFAAVVLFVSMAAASAQRMDTNPPAEMKAIDFLLGDYQGPANMHAGPQTMPSTCTAHAERALNSRFVRSTITYTMDMGGGAKMSIEGMMLLTYDTTAKNYVGWWYDGTSYKVMHMTGNFEGDKLVLISDPIDPMVPGGTPQPTRSIWAKTADGVTFNLDVKNGDKWDPLMDGAFKKV